MAAFYHIQSTVRCVPAVLLLNKACSQVSVAFGCSKYSTKGKGVLLLPKYSQSLHFYIILTRQCVQAITHKQSITGWTVPCSNGTDVLEKLIEKFIHYLAVCLVPKRE